MEKKEEKIEAISYELMEICVKKGLTISEMYKLAYSFPRLIKSEIDAMEQRTNFTIKSD